LEFAIKLADTKIKVFVAGGGPAGMEAAIVAAQRGHEVHLFEKEERLGGQFWLAAVPPSKGEFTSFLNWQQTKLENLNVNIHLNTQLNDEIIEAEKPNSVIIATGGKPIIPAIKGVERQNVVDAQSVLAGKVTVGNKAIVIGGDLVGAETAAHLANHGNEVTIVEQLPAIAKDIEVVSRIFLMEDLMKHNVKILTNSRVLEIMDNEVIISTNDVEQIEGPVDTIVIAVGAKPDNNLTNSWKGVNQGSRRCC
jgi:pyruvate/2-oxoglutarate dehydrogenase complex dihydrolipoamide dehydrogenase (E3) component